MLTKTFAVTAVAMLILAACSSDESGSDISQGGSSAASGGSNPGGSSKSSGGQGLGGSSGAPAQGGVGQVAGANAGGQGGKTTAAGGALSTGGAGGMHARGGAGGEFSGGAGGDGGDGGAAGAPSCPSGQIFCAGCTPGTGTCAAVCPKRACSDCQSITTREACDASANCHSVFVDPNTCGCAAVGCCARFSRCADGKTALCASSPTLSCEQAVPYCESPAFVVAYRTDCYDGCVPPSECAPQ